MAFHHVELRTTDVAAARAFYEAVLAGPFDALLTELPAAARNQGAPAHWLGHLFARDVDAEVARVLAAGGARLGPERETDDGLRVVGIRDPFGAVVALTDCPDRQIARARPVHLSQGPGGARRFYSVEAHFLGLAHDGVHPQWVLPLVVSGPLDVLVERITHHGGELLERGTEERDFVTAHDPQGASFTLIAA
jgi:predicted enzyme related to lactoylglutathione lyase